MCTSVSVKSHAGTLFGGHTHTHTYDEPTRAFRKQPTMPPARTQHISCRGLRESPLWAAAHPQEDAHPRCRPQHDYLARQAGLAQERLQTTSRQRRRSPGNQHHTSSIPGAMTRCDGHCTQGEDKRVHHRKVLPDTSRLVAACAVYPHAGSHSSCSHLASTRPSRQHLWGR